MERYNESKQTRGWKPLTREDRMNLFNSHPFFSSRPSLSEALILIEEKRNLRFPTSFSVSEIPYFIGERQVTIGKVADAYFFGIELANGEWKHQAFESKSSIKLFFSQMKGLEPTEIAFWIHEIENIPVK